jgi:hypothetical protein
MSCGIVELSRIAEEAELVLFAVANHFYHPSRGVPPAFALLSDVTSAVTATHRLISLVTEFGFGDTQSSSSQINPKTGNPISVFTWAINHERFKKWYFEQKLARLKGAK